MQSSVTRCKKQCADNLLRPEGAANESSLYLAFLIGRTKSTQHYDISLLRNRASHVSGPAVPPHADCSPLHRSTSAEPSCACCEQCARLAVRKTIRRIACAADRMIYRFEDVGFTSDFHSSGRITGAAPLCICARMRHFRGLTHHAAVDSRTRFACADSNKAAPSSERRTKAVSMMKLLLLGGAKAKLWRPLQKTCVQPNAHGSAISYSAKR